MFQPAQILSTVDAGLMSDSISGEAPQQSMVCEHEKGWSSKFGMETSFTILGAATVWPRYKLL
jgi:hypothetical protein